MTDTLPLSIQPVISYPKEAEVGKTYLMEIDLQMPESGFEWQYEEEEYLIYCMVNAGNLFTVTSVGEPAIVLHRFGGTYGAAKFFLESALEKSFGGIRITLVNIWGVPIRVINLAEIQIREELSHKPSIQIKGLINQKDVSVPIAPKHIPELTTLEFIGRDRDLTNLANLSRQTKIVLIKAGAGVGKSTLALEFLQTQFKKVIRLGMGLEVGNVTPAEEKVSQILRKDFDEEPSRDFGINLDILRMKLSDRANPISVLIDSLEVALDENYRFREKFRSYDALLSVLGDRDVCSFTLITSRRSLITPRARVHEYSLEGLDITAWRQYFHDCENGTDSEALIQMHDAYNGNAKVMDILHGAIKNRFDGNIGAYWSRYKDALLADLELETLISVEMDWLRDNQPDAYKLLCRMGCYRYQDVKTIPFEGLICLLWDVPTSRHSWVVDYLSKTSLIEVKKGYYLHPAIRESAKSRLLKNKIDWETVNRNAANFWTFSTESIDNISDALHAFEAYDHYISIKNFDSASELIVSKRKNKWGLEESLGESFCRLGLLNQIIYAIQLIVDKLFASPSLGEIYTILGDALFLTGKISNAMSNYQISQRIVRSLLESKDTSKDISNRNQLLHLEANASLSIGLCYLEIWEIQNATTIFQRGIEKGLVSTKTFFSFLFCQAYALSCIDKTSSQVEKLLNRASELFEDINSRQSLNSWNIGYYYFYAGEAYKNIGKIDLSVSMLNKAISYGEETNYIQLKSKALFGLAKVQHGNKNYSVSLEYQIEAIEKFRVINATSDLAEAYFQIGLTYKEMGEHDQAEEYKVIAIKLFEQMEAPKQIERVNRAFA